MIKTGRNDPCPCGSGKKHKKCCLPQSNVVSGLENSVRGRLVEKLLRFCKRNFADKIELADMEFWDGFDPDVKLPEAQDQSAEINFWEWVVFDWHPDVDDERIVIEQFADSAKGLSRLEIEVLDKMKNSVISLYEVQDVRRGEGLTVKDLLRGGVYEIKEKSGSESLRKWDILATRLLNLDGVHIINGGVYPYSLGRKKAILEDIGEEKKLYKLDYPKASIKDFLKENSLIFHHLWMEPFENPFRPHLQTTSGEELIFCKAVYEVSDMSAITDALSRHPDIDPGDENSFVWFGHNDKMEGKVVFGNIEVTRDRLTLECKSSERLEKGKELIGELAQDNARHKADSFEDIYQAMESRKSEPISDRDSSEEIPIEVQQEFYDGIMKRHYEKTLTNKIPMLGGKAPVDAVKTKAGRKKVIEWLKFLENGEGQKKYNGQPYIDLSWIWERLGIDKVEAHS